MTVRISDVLAAVVASVRIPLRQSRITVTAPQAVAVGVVRVSDTAEDARMQDVVRIVRVRPDWLIGTVAALRKVDAAGGDMDTVGYDQHLSRLIQRCLRG